MGKKERKKERKKEGVLLSFGHKAAPELLPAVRYPPFFFFFIPLHLLKKGGRKKALRHSRATTILSSSQNSEFADRDRSLLCLQSDSCLLALFLFWNRFFWVKFWGFWRRLFFGGQLGGRISATLCVCWNCGHLALVSLLVVSVLR